MIYAHGQKLALQRFGLTKTALTRVGVQTGRSPFSEIQRQLSKAFSMKMPEMDVSKQLQRLLGNPFKKPQDLLAGNLGKMSL